MKTLSFCVLFALTMIGFVKPAEAKPPNTHAVVEIKNDSKAYATIYYNFAKNFKWHKEVIQPGETLALSYAYKGTEQTSPPCLVKIDVDTTNGRHIVEYKLAKAASPSEGDFGARYTLRQIPGTTTRALDASSSKAHVEVTDKNGFVPTTVD